MIGALLNQPEAIAYAINDNPDFTPDSEGLEQLFKNLHQFNLEEQVCFFDTPQPEGVGILGSTKPLNQSTLQCFNQRWDSPQA